MSRTRSPGYPSIPLGEAIEYAARIYEEDQRHTIPREVAAQHMGYKSLHGTVVAKLSSLGKYGLLERVPGGGIRISDLGLDILVEPKESKAYQTAIQQAAESPKLFKELSEEFDGTPSDGAIRAYLLKRNFNSTAVVSVIRSYRETMEFSSRITVPQNMTGRSTHADMGAPADGSASDEVAAPPLPDRVTLSHPTGTRVENYRIPLLHGATAVLSLPVPLPRPSFELIQKWLELTEPAITIDAPVPVLTVGDLDDVVPDEDMETEQGTLSDQQGST